MEILPAAKCVYSLMCGMGSETLEDQVWGAPEFQKTPTLELHSEILFLGIGVCLELVFLKSFSQWEGTLAKKNSL